jgi:hypothetical protein
MLGVLGARYVDLTYLSRAPESAPVTIGAGLWSKEPEPDGVRVPFRCVATATPVGGDRWSVRGAVNLSRVNPDARLRFAELLSVANTQAKPRRV